MFGRITILMLAAVLTTSRSESHAAQSASEAPTVDAPQVATESLLGELINLDALTIYPDPPFTCRQFSSYDRDSTDPTSAEKWFANGDAGQFLRTEQRDGRTEYVMADMDGPGAIVRIWSANPAGVLRIYLDRAEKPALEARMADLLGGNVPGIMTPIAGQRSRGWNCYYPIPYAEHCQVTSDAGGFYYHVDYRTYPQGTRVAAFDASTLQSLLNATYGACARLSFPRNVPGRDERAAAGGRSLDLKPHERQAVPFGGPGQIRAWSIRAPANLDRTALRSVVLRMRFDGEQTVETPLADFFGAGPRPTSYSSLPLEIDASEQRLSCFFAMPFEREAEVSFENTGEVAVRLNAEFTVDQTAWTDRAMHFHATWRTVHDQPTRPMIDWNYLHARGQGVFVGAAFAINNPVKQWWGEGDEKIYVDGEAFPSFFGTGTEDYYGYAWCWPEPFQHALHNQTRCDGPGNYGYTAVNRWHIPDRIPFQRELRFDMELWHWNARTAVDMSVVTYWYARPGATAEGTPPTPESLAWKNLPPYTPPRVAGALEGEELRVVEKAGAVDVQPIDACSNEAHLWWREGKIGEKLVLAFDAPAAGRYHVWLRRVKAPDYGIHQVRVNDQPAGEPLDSFGVRITAADEQDLGVFELKAGENRLTIAVTGANPNASPGNMFGLDYVRLEAAE
ncbi:MAG: DUF2961 domain-containing protein [Phycisphaerae bacterium]|jgi:hypothetical protein